MIRVDSHPTLRLCALAAIAEPLIGQINRNGTSKNTEFAYLARVYGEVGSADWGGTLIRCLESPEPEDQALVELSAVMELNAHEILAVALALGVEAVPFVGRILMRVQGVGKTNAMRPTVGLVSSLFEGISPLALIHGVAIRSGLLILSDDNKPLVERSISIPMHLCMALNGLDAAPPGMEIGLDKPLLLPESLIAEVSRHAGMLNVRNTLVLHGALAEGRAAAAEIASSMSLRPLYIETKEPEKAEINLSGITPLIFLRGLLPVFCYTLAPGEHRPAPTIPFYEGGIVCVCGLEGQIERAGGRAVVQRTIKIPETEERRILWHQAIGSPDIATEMALHYRHSSERIAQLGVLAHYEARLNGRNQPQVADMRRAMRTGGESGLDALAQPLFDDIPDEALVVPDKLRGELELLRLRCQTRDQIAHSLGVSAKARYAPGVRALFTGPSGTGKTLAAGWLATHLGLPLYRVDLAAVTSKYIGETEKNLAELLNRAERTGVILLFDEADSMFGKRTDIKDSHDRFANAQTNYLLQRIETFDGIALLTSNSRQRFDPAFTRRLDAILEFPLPGVEERRALWLAHLGDQHQLSDQAITRLAVTVDFAGGHIRNAVLTASVLAYSENRPIVLKDLMRGISIEFAKVGRPVPLGLDE